MVEDVGCFYVVDVVVSVSVPNIVVDGVVDVDVFAASVVVGDAVARVHVQMIDQLH